MLYFIPKMHFVLKHFELGNMHSISSVLLEHSSYKMNPFLFLLFWFPQMIFLV